MDWASSLLPVESPCCQIATLRWIVRLCEKPPCCNACCPAAAAAFPESHFDRLEALQPVWAPYYVVRLDVSTVDAVPPRHPTELLPLPRLQIHKIMAGLLDQHQLAGTDEALKMAEQMAGYFCGRRVVAGVVLASLLLDLSMTFEYICFACHLHAGRSACERIRGWTTGLKSLENEFGGMNEVSKETVTTKSTRIPVNLATFQMLQVLYNLYAATGDDHLAGCAHWFDKPIFYRPLIEGKDPLPGLHANTHLAQVNA